MFLVPRWRSVLCSQAHIVKQRVTNVVYIVIFLYLILYSIFNSIYLDGKPPASLANQPRQYEISNVAVTPIFCAFPVSDQYQRTARYLSYLLLVFTVIIRNHNWLAAGAAASVLTYSGVAAIHMIVLFATNNRFGNLPKTKSFCETITLPGANAPFVACAGVSEPDINLAMAIVSNVMLGALPMAAWSTTFKSSTSKPILTMWLLLLAVGHTFYFPTVTDSNRHFQICPKDKIEPPPKADYQAPLQDQIWRDSLYSLVSSTQQSSGSIGNASSPACIYSCFATTVYTGRRAQNIGVYDFTSGTTHSPFEKTSTANRRAGILFWWAYTFFACLTLFTTEKKGHIPQWTHMRVFSIAYGQQPSGSILEQKTAANVAIASNSITTFSKASSARMSITVLKLAQLSTQLFGAAAFCGAIINQETQNAVTWKTLELEPFAAVGQWSNLVVVLLVLLAIGTSRMWESRGARSSHKWRDTEDVETEEGEWDWRVGYAS